MKFYSKVVLLLVIAAVLVYRVQCFSSGPPANQAGNRNRVCNDLSPNHGVAPQNGNGDYTISTDLPRISDMEYAYTAGQTYTLTLSGDIDFRGFLVIARVPGPGQLAVLGAFTTGEPNQQIIEECDNAGVNMQAAIGHMGVINAMSRRFSWTAPSDADGTVDFRFTVVRVMAMIFEDQSAAQTSLDPIVDPTAPVPTTPPPVPPTLPVRDPEDYRLTFRSPSNCLLDECRVFVGIDSNAGSSDYLDITMQGVAGGWLAVGFTFTQNMFDADVVGCVRDPTNDDVMAIDTWNVPMSETPSRNNVRDTNQDIVLFNSSFVNGTISCTFSRLITGSDPAPQDRDLDNDYFILYGYRGPDNPANDVMRFTTHTAGGGPSPVSSAQMINPVNDNNQPFNGVAIPVRDPEDYRLTFRTPEGCNVTNCISFIGIDTNTGNPGILDIYMEGEAQGWVAVGFTETRNMFDADVVACNRDPGTNMIEALDTYNLPPQMRNNSVDARQNVLLFNSSFDGNRIICTVGKEIAPRDPVPQDINLDSANLYVLWGVRVDDSAPGMLLTHGADVPARSEQQVNPDAGRPTPPLQNRAPGDYRFRILDPPGCDPPSSCDLFVGIDTNVGDPNFLDIYMEGNAEGWLAVGFSDTRNMMAADVVGCNRDPNNNMVMVVDTWNLDVGRGNLLDATQDVEMFSSNFADGRITCEVAKRIAPTDIGQDLDLNAELFIMYGVGPTGSGAQALPPHVLGAAGNPLLSDDRVNAVVFEGVLGSGFPMVPPNRAPGDYRLRFLDPPGCDPPSSCDLFVGIDTNVGDPNFLDIYLDGNAAGWLAVGFSDTRNMMAADVVGCNRDPNSNMVMVVDTWNLDEGRGNQLDATQDVVMFSSNFTNDRITCEVAKRIAPTDDGQDLDLNAELFVMYGVGPSGSGAQSLPPHVLGAAGNPLLSDDRVNVVVFEGELGSDFPMVQLLRAHGILMLIAWPLLAISGIFFAAWMRPALPNGEWFQIHRAFLLSSLFVGALGFMLAFVAHARNPTPGLINFAGNPTGTAHYAIGIIVMLLHIINPIISACRCHPGEKYRWVFNLIHGTTIGLLVEVLALTNIALGLERFGPSSFFSESNPLTIFWVYIGFLIFFLVLIGVLFLVFTLLSLFSQDDDRSKTAPSLIKPLVGSGPDSMHKSMPSNEGVELAVPGQKPTVQGGDDSEKPKVPSKDSPLRWGALTIFLVVNVIMMLVLIILIAIE